MAFDSAEKRRSASALMPPFGVGYTPNSLIDQEGRQQAGWGYSGVVTHTGAPAAGLAYHIFGNMEGIYSRIFGGVVVR